MENYPSREAFWAPMTIGKLAKRSGVSTSALRFYEEKGLIQSIRNESGYRTFQRSTIRRVAFIVFAQRIGLTLDEIREELALLPTDVIPTRLDWSRLSKTWTSRIDARIEELKLLRDNLGECIGCGCLSLDRCQLANPADRASLLGPGPRHVIEAIEKINAEPES